LAISWKWIGLNRSPTIFRPEDRVLHRDHAQLAGAGLHRLERLLEGGARDRLVIRIVGGAGLVAVGPELSLEGDAALAHAAVLA
jgi:hypothetical protein